MISLVNDDKVYTVDAAEEKYRNYRILMYDMDISNPIRITGKIYAIGDKNIDVHELRNMANRINDERGCITYITGYCDEGGFVGVQYIT